MAFDDLKHAQRTRLEFLDRLFLWEGAATRASLIKRFGISNAQAALDFRAYLAEAPKDSFFVTAHPLYKPLKLNNSFRSNCSGMMPLSLLAAAIRIACS